MAIGGIIPQSNVLHFQILQQIAIDLIEPFLQIHSATLIEKSDPKFHQIIYAYLKSKTIRNAIIVAACFELNVKLEQTTF